MIIELDVQLFEDTTPEESKLLRRLFHYIDDDGLRHAVRLTPREAETDPHSPHHSWMETLSAGDEEILSVLLERGALLEPPQDGEDAESDTHLTPTACPGRWRRADVSRVHVARRSASAWPTLRLSIGDTLALVREPLHLHLEHERHDLDFLLWLATERSRQDLRAVLDASRIQIHGGGTGALTTWLKGLANTDTLSPLEMRRLWRSWVMFDKDAGVSDARQMSDTILKLVEWCEKIHEKHHVPLSWVCLQRREIESYVPNRGLQRVRDRKSAAEMLIDWRRRGDRCEWAWAYDMKEGLHGDLLPGVQLHRHEIPAQHQLKAPFDGLNNKERRVLAHGFGPDLLNKAVTATPPYSWLDQLGDEYDLGPAEQLPRAALIQSIFDRM